MLGLTRTFGALYLASLLMQLGSALLMTYLALRLSSMGGREAAGGSLMAANALGMVLGGWVGRWLIGAVGHIRTYAACAGIIAAAVLAHEFSHSVPFWLLLRALVGLAMMCQLMVIESWLNDQARTEQRGAVLALYMVASYVGMMLGQLALALDTGLGIRALLGVAMVFALCSVPVALTRSAYPSVVPSAAIDVRLFLRRIPQSLVTILVSGMINGSFYGLAAIYASKQGLDTAQVGQFMALTIGAGLLAQLPLGWLSDQLPRASLIRGVAVLLILVSLPLGFDQSPSFSTVLLFGAAIGFLQFCLYPLGVALANDNMQAQLRVSLSGMLLVTFGVGACIGPLVAGLLMEYTGASSLYFFHAGCALLLALCVSQTRVSGRHLNPDAPLHQPPTPDGLASSNWVAVAEPVEQSVRH
ncbi:putative MFS-type transporter [Pseudomonas synxantha]|uniref:MFS transporter n=1 Tax=Pseudomonas synxantha TaxID=47883 RepID=UPI000F70A007|nr:MFS transporter [Pseudomonas synxantha]AZE72116.1 putative MFS-type transporter [Pseudomonas synxantha]AZE77780.1 putative MFS-type transporter [Pseudomonas synxantha]